MKSLKGKIVLITGAGKGLGEAIARVIAKEEATIIATNREEDKVKKLAKELNDQGLKAEGLRLDVTSEEEIKNIVKKVMQDYKTIDVLINNAGLDAEPKPLEEYSSSEYDKVMSVNLRGPFLLSKEVLPIMYKNNLGHIVNIGSTASIRTWPNAVLYHMSKVALRGLGWSLFSEIREKKSNVSVTTVIPGGMKTAHVVERFPDMDFSWLQDPMSVAETVRFTLLQPEKSVIPEIVVIPPLEWSLP